MNETSSALLAVDPTLLYPASVAPLPVVDAEAAGMPALPGDHPAWQRDVISLSSRARSFIATVVPAAVRAFTYWDHRIREVAFGTRSLAVDPAGCYRLR